MSELGAWAKHISQHDITILGDDLRIECAQTAEPLTGGRIIRYGCGERSPMTVGWRNMTGM